MAAALGFKRRDDHVELCGLRQRVVHRQGHRCRRGHSPFRSEDGEFDRVDPRVDIATRAPSATRTMSMTDAAAEPKQPSIAISPIRMARTIAILAYTPLHALLVIR